MSDKKRPQRPAHLPDRGSSGTSVSISKSKVSSAPSSWLWPQGFSGFQQPTSASAILWMFPFLEVHLVYEFEFQFLPFAAEWGRCQWPLAASLSPLRDVGFILTPLLQSSVSSCLSAQALLAISLLHSHTPHSGLRHTPVLILQCSVSQCSLG